MASICKCDILWLSQEVYRFAVVDRKPYSEVTISLSFIVVNSGMLMSTRRMQLCVDLNVTLWPDFNYSTIPVEAVLLKGVIA